MGGGDSIDGGAGDDRLSGRQGNDTIIAGDGADILVGGDGADSLMANEADLVADTVLGNDGADVINIADGGAAIDVRSEGDDDDSVTHDGGIEATDNPALDDSINASQPGFEWIDNIMSFLDLV